ncbi:MAG: hypothetical protein JW983_07250 [Elusimicrobia bacterium]|nr:hypothetical protein [Elusimicrobiota bacterium]
MKKTIKLNLIGIGILLFLTLVMFGDILFTFKSNTVLSAKNGDIFPFFLYLRDFGFSQLRQGNLALWNPYIFSGTPYFAEFEPALLYPLNWLYLILPPARAINIGIIIHFLLAGIFIYLWTGYRKLSVPSRILSSALFMLCSAHFMHIFAGHLSNLCTMIWAPLLFLSIDALFEDDKSSPFWIMLGIFAVSMQILAGHPQYVFYTGIAAGIYTLSRVIDNYRRIQEDKKNSIIQHLQVPVGLIIIYLGAILISAVQLFPGLDVLSQTTRGQNTTANYGFCASFSFPPENFLTLLSPKIFGDMLNIPYWGRYNIWEMTLFISITGLLLAICGAVWGDKNKGYLCLFMALICLVLALGKHTPLFKFLYHFVPGFNVFRGNSKFIFLVAMFLTVLAGVGLDWLLNLKNSSSVKTLRKISITLIFISILLFISGITVKSLSSSITSSSSTWIKIMKSISETKETYLFPEAYNDPKTLEVLVKPAGNLSSKSLMISAGITAILSVLFLFIPSVPRIVYMIGVIGIIEVFLFTRNYRSTFDIKDTKPSVELTKFFTSHPGNYRIFRWPMADTGHQDMSYGIQNIWGLHIPSERYARFMAFTRSRDLGITTRDIESNPLLAMLRCKYLILTREFKIPALKPVLEKPDLIIYELPNQLPRAMLIEDWHLCNGIPQIFKEINNKNFDPSKKVILEEPPVPTPKPPRKKSSHSYIQKRGSPGQVEITDTSTDSLTVKAKLVRPAILVMTDPYYSGWNVFDETGKAIQKYKIIPANYILRAIPLDAGEHLLRIEYLPASFQIGKRISVISITVYLAILIFLRYRKLKNKKL